MNDNYQLLSKVGTGSYGEVWRAMDQEKNQIVAMKKMDRTDEKTFISEKRTLIHLNQTSCKFIPKLYKTLKTPNSYYLIMEFIEGHSLKSWALIRQHTHKLCYTYLNMITSLAEALTCLHEHGYSHRDLKLENVIWTGKTTDEPGHVSLIDFGLSCDQRWFSWTNGCSTSMPFGTPYYFSPELWERYLDQSKTINDYFKVDIYAFGILIYMLFHHNQPFFPGDTMGELQDNVLMQNHHYVAMPWPELKELVLAMIHFVPEKRPTINDVYETLKRVRHKYNPMAKELTTIRNGKPSVQKKQGDRKPRKKGRKAGKGPRNKK